MGLAPQEEARGRGRGGGGGGGLEEECLRGGSCTANSNFWQLPY